MTTRKPKAVDPQAQVETDATPEAELGYTPADQWPTGDGSVDATLPSGAKVKLCRPALAWLGITGPHPRSPQGHRPPPRH